MHPCDNVPFIFKGISDKTGRPILQGDWSGGVSGYTWEVSECEWKDIRFLNETDDLAVNNVKHFFHY